MIQLKLSNYIFFPSGICLKAQLLSGRLIAKYTGEKCHCFAVTGYNVMSEELNLLCNLTYVVKGFWVKSRLRDSVCTLLDGFTSLAGEDRQKPLQRVKL